MANNLSIVERRFNADHCLPQDQWGKTTAKTGSPRSAKNASEIIVAGRWADRGMGPQLHLYADPDENAPKLANHLHANHHGGKTIIDSADDPNRALETCFISGSDHPNPIIRAIEDCDTEETFCEMCLRGREGRAEFHPLLQEGLIFAARLIIKQPKPLMAVKTLRSIGKFYNRDFQKALDDVQDDDTWHYWRQYQRATGQTRTGLAAIMRNIQLNWGQPQWQMRDSHFDRTDELLAAGWTVIVEGSKTDRITTNLMRIKFRKAFDFAERQYLQNDPSHFRLTVDEWAHYGLIGENEISRLARGPKHGVSTTLISHGFDTGDEHLNRKIAQLVIRKEAFRASGYAEALEQAKFIMTPAIDPLAVLYTEERKRQVTNYQENSYDVETKTKGKSGDRDTSSSSKSRQTRREPYQSTEIDQVNHYLAVSDNHPLFAAVLMGYKPGMRAVGEFGDVYCERVPKLEDEPWGFKRIGDRRRIPFYQAMAALPYYAKPSTGDFERRSSAGSEERILSQQTSSNGSSRGSKKADTRSPATKLSDVLLKAKAQKPGPRSKPEDQSG